jgi:hypothetical protein
VTIKDLQRVMQEHENAADSVAMQDLQRRLEGRPFYIWNSVKHKSASNPYCELKGRCCFNHIINLPTKNGIPQPLWDYQDQIYRALMIPEYLNSSPNNGPLVHNIEEKKEREQTNQDSYIHDYKLKHLWIKKATGLGITEFMLRFMCWLALRNDDYKNSQMVIITGPNQELAIKCIKRMKSLFEPHGIYFDSKETVIELNGCSIEAYPSNHIDAFRSLTNPKFILVDEGDFFRKSEQEEVRHVAERYIAKSDPYIVMVSTPNRPDGLFASIEKEPFESSIYKKIFLDYTYGLGKIYTREEIEKAKRSPSFPREYELQYQGLIGNVFSSQSIENCQKIEYNPLSVVPNCKVSIGIDPSFGSSKFGVVVTRFVNERIEVIVAEEFERPDFNDMINRVWEIKQKHKVEDSKLTIYVDAANPEIWSSLKRILNEPASEQYVFEKLSYYKKNNINPANYMKVIPIPFSTNGAKMLQHT